MGYAYALILSIFIVPVGLYIWYVAVHVPKRSRRRQEQSWKPLAERIGGRFVPINGVSSFHALTVPFGVATVRALVFDRAVHDPALPQMREEFGGWRTFVQADVPGGRGMPLSIEPRVTKRGGVNIGRPALEQQHVITPLLATPVEAVAWRITPELEQSLGVIAGAYSYVQAGPGFVNLELPGVCMDQNVLEAALRVVGTLAQPTA